MQEVMRQEEVKQGLEFVIDEISERKYWFVRTNGGDYYNEYFNEGFIAVGFNWITDPAAIIRAEEDPVYKRALQEKIKFEAESESTEDKQVKPGLVINQLKRFLIEMSIGDIVLIPSENSQYISFGQIVSDTYLINKSELAEDGCPFIKRRSIKWLKTLKKERLDPYLYKAIMSHHVITDVSDSATFINRSLSDMYIQNDKAHITLRVRTNNPIQISDISTLINSFEEIAVAADFSPEEIKAIKEAELKINVQSPGPVEFVIAIVGIGVVIGVIMAINVYRALNAAKEQGGEVTTTIGLSGITQTCKINGPSQESDDIDTQALAKKVLNSPDAVKKLEKITEALDRLDTKLPNEKDSHD